MKCIVDIISNTFTSYFYFIAGGQDYYTNGEIVSSEGCREVCLNSTIIQMNPNDGPCQGTRRKRGQPIRLNSKFHRN